MTEVELRDRFQERCGEGEKLLWVGEGRRERRTAESPAIAGIAALFATVNLYTLPGPVMLRIVCPAVLVSLAAATLLIVLIARRRRLRRDLPAPAAAERRIFRS
jgi:hypothetical protein